MGFESFLLNLNHQTLRRAGGERIIRRPGLGESGLVRGMGRFAQTGVPLTHIRG